MERKQKKNKKENKKSAWNRRGISVAICSRGLIYKSVRAAVGRRGVCLHSHRRFFLRRPVKEEPKGLERARRRNEKGGTEEARVTEEFRNDRRPVASLTDDALLRSRLQAQKDGTAVMDSKWLEIVGRCHRATPFCLSFSFFLSCSLSLSLFGYLYLLSSLARNSRHAMYSFKNRPACMELHKILVYFFACLNFRSHGRDCDIFKKQIARHTEYFIEYIHCAVQRTA